MLTGYTVTDLRSELKFQGLYVTGIKADLIRRLAPRLVDGATFRALHQAALTRELRPALQDLRSSATASRWMSMQESTALTARAPVAELRDRSARASIPRDQ